MRGVNFMIILFGLSGCMNTQQKEFNNMSSGALYFFKSKKYNFSKKKSEIPIAVMDIISDLNHERFKIGDNSDTGKINFSDASLEGYEYKRKLHFVLFRDSFCLISYTEGGLGTHDVVDFVKYKGEYNHTRYVTTKIVSDTTILESYLKSAPKPVEIK